MSSSLAEIFEDRILKEKIRNKLPYLFNIAELESSRAGVGRVEMEVGSARERILMALLIYKFGEENVETHILMTDSEEQKWQIIGWLWARLKIGKRLSRKEIFGVSEKGKGVIGIVCGKGM